MTLLLRLVVSPGRFMRLGCGVLLCAVGAMLPVSAAGSAGTPLPQAHAHNDYHHARPLLDALDHGFCNIEADVHLIDGALLVAHDREDVKPGRTLASLYLEPLRARIRENGGRVYRDGPAVTLLVDVKSDAASTYAALELELQRYADILTVFRRGVARPGAVTVIVSGNRAHAEVAAREVRHSALDGRSTDLDSNAPATLYPWISDNWAKVSSWRGAGELPEADRRRLHDWVRRAHAHGRKLRFWNTPEGPAVWRELQAAGVDVIGTDQLGALRDFLLAAKTRHP